MKRKMNKQDKLFERVKKAAEKQEQQPFDRKEEVWDTVSQKLNPKKRKRMILYRTLSAAAVITILIFAGFQFTENQDPLNENPIINKDVKLNDTQDTEVVEDIKDKLKEAENYDIKFVDSVANIESISKASKKENIVSNRADVEKIEDVEETINEIKTEDHTEKQNLVSSSAERISVRAEDSQTIKSRREAQVAVLDKVTVNGESDSSVDIQGILNNATPYETNSQKQDAAINEHKLSIPHKMYQNQNMINGTVVDEGGLPIPGVNVIVKDTTEGTQTDIDGKFSIEVEEGKTLVFSYVGFKTQEVKIKNQNELSIVMEFSSEALEEVVVTSLSQRKNRRKQKALANAQYDSEVNSVHISTMPAPQEKNQIRVKGDHKTVASQQPLFIVDGKMVSDKAFSNLSPNEIKSINVIKSKSEIFQRGYGEKGKNGVIEISTQKDKDSDIKPDSIVKWYNQQYNNEDYESFKENPFTSPLSEPLSTFSIDVDRAAYTNIRRLINNGQDVPKDAVRIEEMLNFFQYNYDKPDTKHPFAIHTAYSDAPWNEDHKLLQIALQGKDIPLENLPASNLVFLIDVSGSMSSQNKLGLVKKSLNLLVDQMRPKDNIALVTYAGNSQVVLEPTSSNQNTKIKNAIDKLSSGGGTYASEGIETAYSLAEENFVKNGNNRVIIATDGDFNIGVTKNESLETLIAKKRKTNIFLTCLGYGMGNYKDSKMQSLSQKGNGNYAYIDTYQEAQKFLEREFKGNLYAIAKDVKIQIEFNPKHVDSYRLIGYETRMLEDRDFADDTKDAGEIGVNHQVTALYEVIPRGVESTYGEFRPELKYQKIEKPKLEGYSDELATVKFRYKPPKADKSIKLERIIKNKSVKLNQASGDFKFATAVAWFGLKLRDSELINKADKEDIINLAKQGLENDKEGYRAEFIRLVRLYD